jgi:site-specific recombinase XerD
MNNLGLVDDDQKSKYSPHSIRHSVVSDLLGKGENLYTISKILRHSDIRTTINIYGHLLKEDVLESLEKIGS